MDDSDGVVRERYLEYTRLSKANQRIIQLFFRYRSLDEYLSTLRRNIADAKRQHASDMVKMETQFRNHLAHVHEGKSKATAELKDLLAQQKRLEGVVGMLEDQYANLEAKLADLKARNSNTAAHVQSSAVRLAEAQQIHDSKQHDVDMAEVENENLRAQLVDAKDRETQYIKEAVEAEEHDALCKLDLDKLRAESKVKIAEMRQRLDGLLRESSALEDILRKEFGQKLQKTLSACQKAAQLEKNQGLGEMKAKYDMKWADFNNRMQSTHDENDHLRQKIVDATLELNSIKNQHRSDLTLAKSEERRAESCRVEIESIEASIERAHLEDQFKIDELNELLSTKDHEYASLLKIKDDLAMEIRAYRLLLETEEDRMGNSSYISPSKKRRGGDELPMTIKAAKKVLQRVNSAAAANKNLPERRTTRSTRSRR